MKVLFYVMNDASLLSEILDGLQQGGIRGCTILDADGMARELAKKGRPSAFNSMVGSLRSLIEPNLNSTKILMFVLDESKIDSVIAIIENVVGNLEDEGTGIAFGFPLDFVKGLKL